MSTYLNELKEATCYLNKADFPELLEKIKAECTREKWKAYGWRESVLSAESFEKMISEEFGIELEPVYGNYVRPVIKDVYESRFLRNLIEIAAPYMTDGEIIVRADFDDIRIVFANGKYGIDVNEQE